MKRNIPGFNPLLTETAIASALRSDAARLRELKEWSERQRDEPPPAALVRVEVAIARAMLARLPLATVGPAPTFGPDLMRVSDGGDARGARGARGRHADRGRHHRGSRAPQGEARTAGVEPVKAPLTLQLALSPSSPWGTTEVMMVVGPATGSATGGHDRSSRQSEGFCAVREPSPRGLRDRGAGRK